MIREGSALEIQVQQSTAALVEIQRKLSESEAERQHYRLMQEQVEAEARLLRDRFAQMEAASRVSQQEQVQLQNVIQSMVDSSRVDQTYHPNHEATGNTAGYSAVPSPGVVLSSNGIGSDPRPSSATIGGGPPPPPFTPNHPTYPPGLSPHGGIPPLLSGFSAPKAPRYSGYSIDARRNFAAQYQEYVRECASAAASIGMRIGIRSIGSCIEAKSKLFAATMHLGKTVDAVTESEWMAYFQYALDHHGPDFGDLVEKLKSHVIMDEKELDVDRCYDKWVLAYWSILQRNNMMDFHEKYPKYAVKALIPGLRPAALRKVVEQCLEMSHRHLRS
ncbi:unnamed protein product [Aphanomyces euteiches]|uniref:Uncharacterized protein n=1 Tax=Aphanomyces euteiches TaxID=100861 RepID=A0A6G0XQG2_9STRA|nr:hypothetical protein Ae201684_002453 [Aphanomyces euteiches]KAH9087077.1 hypothetical protein Ae201684P_000489 [Aphanomyces euteiches]KAH9152760.1 hypothetical protein AeRB84_004871 [Aphanomyces euteiches]